MQQTGENFSNNRALTFNLVGSFLHQRGKLFDTQLDLFWRCGSEWKADEISPAIDKKLFAIHQH